MISVQDDLRLRALDPDLPFLASEAAIDIDNLLSNRANDLTAIKQFAEKLTYSFEPHTSDDSVHSLMDPATQTIVSEAISKAGGDLSSKKIKVLLSEAATIAKDLSRDDLTENPHALERARDFCVALSNTVTAYRTSLHDIRTPHPFRR